MITTNLIDLVGMFSLIFQLFLCFSDAKACSGEEQTIQQQKGITGATEQVKKTGKKTQQVYEDVKVQNGAGMRFWNFEH